MAVRMDLYRRHIAPCLIASAMKRQEFTPYRRRVTQAVHGHVLEIGIGSGGNLPHYPRSVEKVVGVDPSRKLLTMACQRASACGFPVNLVEASAEALPLPDNSIDTVIGTWVLCSVSDPSAALQEIRRVLRPGGCFRFVEHGFSPQRQVNIWQICLNPIWRQI